MIDTEDRHKNIHNLEVDDDGTYHYTDGNGTHFIETPPKRKKKISFFGGYDTSRMPKITNKKTEKVGGFVDPSAAEELQSISSRFEDPQVQSALKARGWSDERIGNLISTNRDRIKNLARLRETVVTPSGVEIPLHAGVNIGDKTSLSGHANLGIGSYGVQMGGEKPWGINLSHDLGGGQGIQFGVDNGGFHAGGSHDFGNGKAGFSVMGTAGAGSGIGAKGFYKFGNAATKASKIANEVQKKGAASGVLGALSSAGLGLAISSITAGLGKVWSKFENDKIHGKLQKNPPAPIKKAWEIGLKNLSDDDVFSLVEEMEKTKNGLWSKYKDKDNGAYKYFSQELKHFYQERIRRGKRRWADAYVKNWAEGKHPDYEKYLSDRLKEDMEIPEVKKHIGEPSWENPNDWKMVDRTKEWLPWWGTPERLDMHHNNFETERIKKIEDAFNANLDEHSKGHPEGFRDFLKSQFDLGSLNNSSPENINDLFSGLSNNGEINNIRNNFDTHEAERIAEEERVRNSQEAKNEFDRLLNSFTYYDDKDTKNELKDFLRSHFDLDSLEHANKNDVRNIWENWEKENGGRVKIRGRFRQQQAAAAAPTTPTAIPFASTPTPTPQPQPQPVSDDVDIARHENEANGNFWSRYNPMPALSSYFSKMANPNEDADLKRFQNQYNNLAAKFSVPKHTPPQYFEDDPKDTLTDKISKFRLRYLQEARRMRPPNPEKLRGNKNNLGWTRDMINLVAPK